MRIENTEERLGNFGEFVVNFEVDARCEKGEGFDEAFNVRVFAGVGTKNEARGNFGIFFGELGAHLAQKGELALVIV